MATPQGGYPPQGYPQQDQYESIEGGQYGQQQEQPAYDDQMSPPPQPSTQPAGGRKKRAYAGQAYELGAGANAGLPGQQQQQGGYPGAQGGTYGAAGYEQPQQHQQPQMGYPQPGYPNQGAPPTPASPPDYGQPQYGAGGYQPPDQGYPAHGATSMLQGGVSGVTQQFGQMGLGGGQQQPPPPSAPMRLNQLYPTDLQSQPFNVAELDLPPPPIILPPNV